MNVPINITFTLSDLLIGSCMILGLAVLVYLLLVLKHTYQLLKSCSEFYRKNSEYIDIFVKDGSIIVHKAGVVAESIPEEPLAIFNEFKGGFSFVQTLISLLMSFISGNKNK